MNIFKIKCFVLLIIIGHAIGGQAQGLHFSYLQFAPQSINPGLIGGFSGSYRGTALYREQYNNKPDTKGYKSMELGFDVPVIRGFRKQDWIGAGISLDVDKSGLLNLNDKYSRMGVSYHLGLNPKQTSIFSFGLQMTNISRTLDGNSQFITGYTITGRSGPDPDVLKLMTAKDPQIQRKSKRDLGTGFMYTATSKTNVIKAGLSVYGVLDSSLFRLVGYATMINQINNKTSIEPSLIFQTGKYGNEVMLNAQIGYKFKKNSNDKIKGGLGLRTGTTSLVVLLGGESKGVNYGISLDLPFGGYADATGTQYAVELGASYIGFLNKTPKPKPIIICPRL
jgi:hypothetical protein